MNNFFLKLISVMPIPSELYIKSDIEVEQAVEDADGLIIIINTAKRILQEYSVCEDVDLLVLLSATAGACNNIYTHRQN